MSTGLLSISGADFEQLFETGGGNQLLYIYANDGQDIGQKFLNVSDGSAISANTGFQVSDGSDVRTKLCGKNLAKINFAIQCRWQSGFIYIDIVVSGLPSGQKMNVNGSAYFQYRVFAQYEDDRDEDFTTAITFNTSVSNGTTRLGSWSYNNNRKMFMWWTPYERHNDGKYYFISNATFSFGSRTFSTARTDWRNSNNGKNMDCSGSF